MPEPKPSNPCVINNGGTSNEDIHLRDLFAAAALAGYCANSEYAESPETDRATWSYMDADAMLAEREKESR